ncbi:MAG: ribosome small subunit-dependent GTPase A [Deltaproteobacteria bacterium]|nr:ribosome small subunit-dependent GTPase A [Deltaproteobacteria bacterium]
MTKLSELGWDEFFAAQLTEEEKTEIAAAGSPALAPVRVIAEQKRYYRVDGEQGEAWAELSGKLSFDTLKRAELPAVGDWVLAQLRGGEGRGTIQRVLARRTKFSRKAAGEVEAEQIVATNIDVAFVVMALNQDFNVARLERYLTVVAQSGASPVILMTKRDLCADLPARLAEIEAAARGVPLPLLGSSGVGKSTLVNTLAGEQLQDTAEVRESDGRGRHVTTYRRLLILKQGLLIDTPGMRELHIWEGDDAVAASFEDIEELGRSCKFSNCAHESEPGCAVKAALEAGTLDARRHANYLKLQREGAFQARKNDKVAASEEKKRWRKIHQVQKKNYKNKIRPE